MTLDVPALLSDLPTIKFLVLAVEGPSGFGRTLALTIVCVFCSSRVRFNRSTTAYSNPRGISSYDGNPLESSRRMPLNEPACIRTTPSACCSFDTFGGSTMAKRVPFSWMKMSKSVTGTTFIHWTYRHVICSALSKCPCFRIFEMNTDRYEECFWWG